MKTFETKAGTKLPLLNLKGKDYLQVAHRLIWFREEKPDWSIETEVTCDKDSAIAKAIIKDEQGRIRSMAHKSENLKGFPDFIEKSETGAIGRALALVGYGTQFAPELDEADRIVDAPIIRPEQPGPNDGAPNAVHGYRIPFGKYKGRAIEEIDPKEMASYYEYLSMKSVRDNKEITGIVLEFMQRAAEYIDTAPSSVKS